MKFKFTTISELEEIIDTILPTLQYKIILLEGNLGAGKTTFTQLFCKKLGCKDAVTSPTYSIVNEYHYDNAKIFHFDLYRLQDLEEAYDIGIEDYIYSGEFCLIEWPEIFEKEIAENFHKICIFSEENLRTLTLDE